MRSNRSQVWVERTYANLTVIQAVGKFLRYIHYRDPIQRGEEGQGLPGLVRYVAFRDQTSAEGRLFTRRRSAGDLERRALQHFVRRSLESVPAAVLGRKFSGVPASYRFVLSPEDARGLDLRRLTREVMGQLERDAGALPPWIAAEHRNTGHPHTHIVMAAHREVTPGQFRRVVVTRGRLARMKAAMSREIELQRGDRQPEPLPRSTSDGRRRVGREHAGDMSRPEQTASSRQQLAHSDPFRFKRARTHRTRGVAWYPMRGALARLAAHYRRELERQEREMRRWRFSGRDAGEEREWEV